jgi:hypothetical protein
MGAGRKKNAFKARPLASYYLAAISCKPVALEKHQGERASLLMRFWGTRTLSLTVCYTAAYVLQHDPTSGKAFSN